MANLGGLWSTASVYGGDGSDPMDGGSYYSWEEAWVILTVTIVDPELLRLSEHPDQNVQPSMLIEVHDTETDDIVAVPQVTSAGIQRNAEATSDTFSLTMKSAREISPRIAGAFQGRLAIDTRKHIRIHGGFFSKGEHRRIRLFTGVLLDRSESWNAVGSSMTCQGLNLSYLLTVAVKVLEDYRGSLVGALMQLLEDTQFYGVLLCGFPDVLITDPAGESLDVVSGSLAEAIETLMAMYGTTTWYVDAYGNLIIRTDPFVTEPSFEYTTGPGGNVTTLSPGSSGRAVLSEIAVTGADETVTGLVVRPENVERFGQRRAQISSKTITTPAQVLAAAEEEFDRSERALRHLAITPAGFNPLLDPLMRLTVRDEFFGTGIDTILNLFRFSHTLSTSLVKTNSLDGETEQEM